MKKAKVVKRKVKTPPAKTWLGKRLTNTENDGLWTFVSKGKGPVTQLILQNYTVGAKGKTKWCASIRMGRLSVRSKADHGTEWEARKCVERQLLWYQSRLYAATEKHKHYRSLPPLTEMDE